MNSFKEEKPDLTLLFTLIGSRVVFVYQRVGGLSSYDQVFLAPVNIFS